MNIKDLKPGDRVMQKGTVNEIGKYCAEILWDGEINPVMYESSELDGIEKCDEPTSLDEAIKADGCPNCTYHSPTYIIKEGKKFCGLGCYEQWLRCGKLKEEPVTNRNALKREILEEIAKAIWDGMTCGEVSPKEHEHEGVFMDILRKIRQRAKEL